MTRTEVLAELRSIIDDTVAPYAWSNARLMNWLSLGQTQFCRDSGFFRDSQNYTLTTIPGIMTYPLAPEIIEVLSVWNGVSQVMQDVQIMLFDAPSAPFGWKVNLDSSYLALSAPPDAVYTLSMRVWRGARTALTSQGGELEISPDFHLAPVEWAAAKAFGDHDRERQDPVKAADHLANYKAIAREGKRAFRKLCGGETAIVPNALYLV